MTSPYPFFVTGCCASTHSHYHGSCCHGAHGGHPWWSSTPWPSTPWPSAPWQHHPGPEHHQFWMPNIESVDPASSPKTIIIGGASPSSLTLEYMPVDGAVAPSVKVTVDGPGLTATLEDAAVTAGYHIKSKFQTVDPGTKVTIVAAECIARLRWCESATY